MFVLSIPRETALEDVFYDNDYDEGWDEDEMEAEDNWWREYRDALEEEDRWP